MYIGLNHVPGKGEDISWDSAHLTGIKQFETVLQCWDWLSSAAIARW
ncbi:Phosphomethylpyrimidine synthase [Labeo rohita]|uniref:Phosphomethylpyrimidine synthase n=1 Tax=Labeo rohita TaxID=84645 RepID=A0ABQ8L6Q4_LABRO|nr:Phosphomethylpyrimidine synthase [Labeo rohita]